MVYTVSKIRRNVIYWKMWGNSGENKENKKRNELY